MTMPVGDFTQMPVGPQPVQICPPLGNGVTVTIYNADVFNVVTVSRDNSVGLNAGNGAPIQPLTSAVLDASKALYAVAPLGTASLVILPQGGALSPSPAQIAAQINALGLAKETTQLGQATTIPNGIASTGVPLLTKSALLGSGGPSALAGNASVILLNNVPCIQIGYEISLSIQQSSVVAIFPLIAITMTWTDSVTGLVTAIDKIYTSAFQSAPANTPLVTIGMGKSKGDLLTLTVANTVNTPVTYSWSVAQNSRVYDRDEWRWLGYTGLPGAGHFSSVTQPTFSETESNILAVYNLAGIIAGTTVTCIVPLYNGDVWLHVDETNVSPANMICEMQTQASLGAADVFSGPVGGGLNGNPINVKLSLPRSPCILSFTNNGSVNAIVNSRITISEQAA